MSVQDFCEQLGHEIVDFLVDKFGIVDFASTRTGKVLKPKGPRVLRLCLSAGLQNLLLQICLRGNDIPAQKDIFELQKKYWNN